MSKKNFQRLIFDGNLMADPSMRYTPKGTPVTTLIVASNDTHTNGSDEVVESLVKFKVSVWGNMAAPCNQYLRKGSHVLVEGKLVACQKEGAQRGGPVIWKDTEGNARADFEVNAAHVQFLDRARARKESPQSENSSETSALAGSEEEYVF